MGDETPIRIEFVLEGRIPIEGRRDDRLGVPVLTREDLYAEKLLANADRALDRSQRSRDLIDLAFMIRHWGPIPTAATDKATRAYGNAIGRYYAMGVDMLRDPAYRSECLMALAMPPESGDDILRTLEAHPAGKPA
ncbi:nucleotidyl transferase AbiEii/AbiGii toxin family protein [Luteimonas salinilitoris]|uniref:Nucleotidyl transferase AbiEii/AbiGii toxin family protein n=1 Tax=Luteimonas salinilitoris TaxID=3237697 RepID=A0ABV4HND2_9GAMM